jgi:hypothetical protein
VRVRLLQGEEHMTHEEQIAKLIEMLEIQQKLHETAIDMLKPAIEAEREACAKLVEEYETDNDITATWLNIIAEAIRARNKHED